MIDDPLGQILVERQFLPLQDCRDLLATAKAEDRFLEEILIRERNFSRQALLKILENEYFCPSVDLEGTPGDPALLSAIPRRLAARHLVLPVSAAGQAMNVAFSNPTDAKAAAALSQTAGRTVTPMVALRHDLRDTIQRRYDELERELSASAPPDAGGAEPRPPGPQAPVGVRTGALLSLGKDESSATVLVETLIGEAAQRGTTDIHIEPKEHELLVRFRLDGVLCKAVSLPASLAPSLVSRIKILGGMDIAERRLPHDGRHTVKKGDQFLDLRISSVPS